MPCPAKMPGKGRQPPHRIAGNSTYSREANALRRALRVERGLF
jgi:hypothetical protein